MSVMLPGRPSPSGNQVAAAAVRVILCVCLLLSVHVDVASVTYSRDYLIVAGPLHPQRHLTLNILCMRAPCQPGYLATTPCAMLSCHPQNKLCSWLKSHRFCRIDLHGM
jgi:hypothetical protein